MRQKKANTSAKKDAPPPLGHSRITIGPNARTPILNLGRIRSSLRGFMLGDTPKGAPPPLGGGGGSFQFVALLLAGSFLVRLIDLPWLPTLREEADVLTATDRIRARRAIASEASAQQPKAKTRAQEVSHTSFPLRFRVSRDERVSEGTFLLGASLELPAREDVLRKGDHVRHYVAVINPDQSLRQEWQCEVNLLAAGILSASEGLRRSVESPSPSGKRIEEAINNVHSIINRGKGLPVNDPAALSECHEHLYDGVSQLSSLLIMAGVQSGMLEINRFLDWSRRQRDSRAISTLVNEDGRFHAAFEEARNHEALLRELTEDTLRVSLDREGYWKIVVFSRIDSTWHSQGLNHC